MGPNGSGHREEISPLQTSHSIDKRESQEKIKWLVVNNLYPFFHKEG